MRLFFCGFFFTRWGQGFDIIFSSLFYELEKSLNRKKGNRSVDKGLRNFVLAYYTYIIIIWRNSFLFTILFLNFCHSKDVQTAEEMRLNKGESLVIYFAWLYVSVNICAINVFIDVTLKWFINFANVIYGNNVHCNALPLQMTRIMRLNEITRSLKRLKF